VSVCISARRAREMGSDPYLSVSEGPAWETLARLTDVHPRLARDVLRGACGLEPCPNNRAVVEWLEANAPALGAVMDPDPATAPSIDIDLSVGTPLVEEPSIVGTEAFNDIVFGRMRDAGVQVAIGHYDEARVWYTSAQYAGTDGEHPERRTVHLGVDLFAEPGTPVLAPLDGRVHSVRNNTDHLDYGPTVILEHKPRGGPTFYTLYGHLAKEALALKPGSTVATGRAFAHIGSFAVNGHWPPHLHFQIVTDLLDRAGEFPGVAAPSRRATWLSLSPDPNLVLHLPRGTRSQHPGAAALRAARRERLGYNLSLSYAEPLHMVRGRGTYLYDAEGREYLDCVNNVCHVGHAHPRVVQAAREQMAVLNSNTRYLHETILRYAERLVATFPAPLSVCFFVNSGSEANELALRLARAHSGGHDFVVLESGYHGNTTGLVDASHYKFAGPGGKGAPAHVHAVVMPDDYRGPYRRGDSACGVKYAEHVARAIATTQRDGRRVAGFLVESLLSCGGQIELPPGYLHAAFAHVRQAGGVCIADEVQVGFGRVGSHMWGFETQGVVPDIVTMGKPIGNGHPLGAVVTTPQIAASFHNGMEYFSTFGGNPVSCAAGLAVLDVLRDEALQRNAREVGGYLKDRLTALRDRHRSIGDVRGLGLFLGIEFVSDRAARTPSAEIASYAVGRAKDHGVLLSTDGPDHNVIKIKPPLVFGRQEADRLVEVLDRVLQEDAVVGRS
jgi:4-aminobutyrate aminotransferase-like enzyme